MQKTKSVEQAFKEWYDAVINESVPTNTKPVLTEEIAPGYTYDQSQNPNKPLQFQITLTYADYPPP